MPLREREGKMGEGGWILRHQNVTSTEYGQRRSNRQKTVGPETEAKTRAYQKVFLK